MPGYVVHIQNDESFRQIYTSHKIIDTTKEIFPDQIFKQVNTAERYEFSRQLVINDVLVFCYTDVYKNMYHLKQI